MKLASEYKTFLANVPFLYIKIKHSNFNCHCFMSFIIVSEQMIQADIFSCAYK